jgi:hypothetical protein
MAEETRAQIGFYNDGIVGEPIAVFTRLFNGHPTGRGGVVVELLDIVPGLVKSRGEYEATLLAAQLLASLVEIAPTTHSYAISNHLELDVRFFYAVTPAGITVYDARTLRGFEEIEHSEPMFHSAWVEPDKTLELEKEVRKLEDELSAKRLLLEGQKRKQFRRIA